MDMVVNQTAAMKIDIKKFPKTRIEMREVIEERSMDIKNMISNKMVKEKGTLKQVAKITDRET